MLVGEFGGAVRERPFDATRFINRAIRDVASDFAGGYRATGVPESLAGGPIDILKTLEQAMGPGGEILDTPAREILEMARVDYDAMRAAEELTGAQAMEYLRGFSERAISGAVARPFPEIVVDRPVPLSRAYGEFTDTGFQLTSGRADYDRHPNVYYSPMTERQLRGQPARDTDPGNYRYMLDKIMGARTQEEVERILEPIHRTYDPKRGVQFAAGQLGVNRASQLMGLPEFRGRGTVFYGEHISDTLSRQGSLVIPQQILATGGPRALELEGLEPEIWQPRQGFAGAASLLPLPGDTDISHIDVIKHIRDLPRGSGDRQLPLFERQRLTTPSRAVDTARAQQLKLLSGAFSEVEESPERQAARAIYDQFQGYRRVIEETGQLHPMDIVNNMIRDVMFEGIPAIEADLHNWQRKANIVSRRWDDFEKAARAGEQVRPQARKAESEKLFKQMSEMAAIEQEAGIRVGHPDLRRALESVRSTGGQRTVESNLDYYKELLTDQNREWQDFLKMRTDYADRAEKAGVNLKDFVEDVRLERDYAVDTRDPRVLNTLVGRLLDQAQPQPIAEQLQFIHATQPPRPQAIEPLGRGLEGMRTYGFELEFFSDTGLDEIEDVLGTLFDIEMDYDSSLEEATGSDNEELVTNIFENLVKQFEGSGIGESEIMDMAREEADDVSYEMRRDRELISPVYRGEADIYNVQGILENLQQFAPSVNETAGMHVHVGSEGLRPENYINLLGNYMQRERVIDMVHDIERTGFGPEYARSLRVLEQGQLQMPLIGQQRFGQRGVLTANLNPMTYGGLTPTNQVVMQQAFKNYMNRVAGQYAPPDTEIDDPKFEAFRRRVFPARYRKLNIQGSQFQTVEYRQPAATLDPNRIEQQIRFITNFVERYKDVPFTPAPEANIAETFQELGFRLSEVQDPVNVRRLQHAAGQSGIELLSGRNLDQELYDLITTVDATEKYAMDKGRHFTQDQTFDLLGQFVEGVEDYLGFGG